MLEELALEIVPYIRPLGYVVPPAHIVQDLRDRFPKDTTPTMEYCIAAASGNRNVQTLCLILGA